MEEREERNSLFIGGGLFAVGMILHWIFWEWWTAVPLCIAYLVLGWEVLKTAGKNILHGEIFDENFLMSVATLGAIAIGNYPEAVGVMLFYRVGEYLEDMAVERSRENIASVLDLRPETVCRVTAKGVENVDPAEVVVGDILRVLPGERVGLDGTVLSGQTQLDTSAVTGEPVPVTVQAGDEILSGCVNLSGQITLRVEKPLAQSMVTRILEATNSAEKPKMERFITSFSKIYTPTVVSLALLIAVVPSIVTGQWHRWIYSALSFLVMSCPCALVISVPLTFFASVGRGSKRGILCKGANAMEALAEVNAVALDKTGTVTEGNFTVKSVEGPADLLQICASCEQFSTHPIAMSILAAAKDLPLTTPEQTEEVAGQGIRAKLNGKTVLCGNKKLLDGIACPDGTVLVAVDGAYYGRIQITDTVKDGAKEAVSALHALGLQTVMLTGDRSESAQAVADTLNIDSVYAGLMPTEKLSVLQKLRKKYGKIAFVGDGINDAPVLAGADVGIAMGSGTDAAMEAADAVLLKSDASAIAEAVRLAKKTKSIAVQNVVFALAVKVAVMVLGVFGIGSMWLAVLADTGVTLLCVLNSVRELL